MDIKDIPEELLQEIVEQVVEQVEEDDPIQAIRKRASFIDNVSYFDVDNAVPVWGEINEEQSIKFFNRLNILSTTCGDDEPITIYINSPGGDVTQATAMIDALRSVPNPIITVATGMCGSAGLFLFAAGDKRLAYENAIFFYHEPISRGSVSSPLEAESMVGYYNHIRKIFNDILYKACSNIKRRSIYDKRFLNNTSLYITPKEARDDLGLVHKVIGQG